MSRLINGQVEGGWLGNIRLTEVIQARGIVNLMMPRERKVDATILIARGVVTPAEAVSSVSVGSPRQRPVLTSTFWLRT